MKIARLSHEASVGADARNKQEIIKMVPELPGSSFLDLGCDDGLFTLQVAQAAGADRIFGVEIDPGRAAQASSLGIDVHRGDLSEPLPYQDEFFDLILANQVIEHLYFTDDFIKEVRRTLKPGGSLVLSTTNLAALHYRLMLLAGWQPSSLHPSEIKVGNHLAGGLNPRYGHKSVFTYKAILQFLKYYGFEIQKARTVAIHPFPDSIASLLTRVRPAWGIYSTILAVKPHR